MLIECLKQMIDTIRIWTTIESFQGGEGWRLKRIPPSMSLARIARRLWVSDGLDRGLRMSVLKMATGEFRAFATVSLPRLLNGTNSVALDAGGLGAAAALLASRASDALSYPKVKDPAAWSISGMDIFVDVPLSNPDATRIVRWLAPIIAPPCPKCSTGTPNKPSRWCVRHRRTWHSFRLCGCWGGVRSKKPGASILAYDKMQEVADTGGNPISPPGSVLRVELRMSRGVREDELYGFRTLDRIQEYAEFHGIRKLAVMWNKATAAKMVRALTPGLGRVAAMEVAKLLYLRVPPPSPALAKRLNVVFDILDASY